VSGSALLAENKKARFDYEVLKKFEAGLVLKGSEVKSMRAKQIHFKDAYVSIKNGEAFLVKLEISPYVMANIHNHEPDRMRKLLLNKHEIVQIESQLSERGLTCVPLKVYLKGGKIKAEIALVRGKKYQDKRQDIKKRRENREISRALKLSR
jgi:SsrA-binding protein